MSEKLMETRFTIQFSRTDPAHLRVAGILNRQGRRSKAQYIVNAVLHYENCEKLSGMSVTDLEKLILEIIHREMGRINGETAFSNQDIPSGKDEVVSVYEDVFRNLDKDGLSAITDAIEQFRRE